MDLKTYLLNMPLRERGAFATACGTTYGHLRNVAYGFRPCSAALAINLERESNGDLRVEDLCPVADWHYIRAREAPGLSRSPTEIERRYGEDRRQSHDRRAWADRRRDGGRSAPVDEIDQ